MSHAQPDAPSRATRRPAGERRRQLAAAAAEAFHRHGFHQVTIAGVARSVGVSPPAVYRHFDSKDALLAAAVSTGLDVIRSAVDGDGSPAAAPLPAIVGRLADAGLRRPDFWTLLQREVRHLEPGTQQRVRAEFRAVIAPVEAALAAARPDLDRSACDLVATAVTAVLATPSAHPVRLPRGPLRRWLASAADAVRLARLPPRSDGGPDDRPPPAPPGGKARSEVVLDAAVSLFHRHGYAAVSIDDIGAAAGMAGPSVYHHFPTKADLLTAATDRVVACLPRADDLDTVVRSYVAMAMRHRESLGLYVTEGLHLPAAASHRVARTARADRTAWTALLRDRRPELDGPTAALLVDAARTVVHDVVRIGRLHRAPGVADALVSLALAVLLAPAPGDASST